jgi:hypothetical protein
MRVDGHDYRYNFRLFGGFPEESDLFMSLGDGFRTLFRVGTETGELFTLSSIGLHSRSVRLRTFVQVIGPVAIVSVRITNEGTASESVGVSIGGNLSLNGESQVPCFGVSNGLTCFDRWYSVTFSCFGESIGDRPDSLWFGDAETLSSSFWSDATLQAFTGGSTAIALSWQNRIVPAGKQLVLSTIVRWGAGSQRPILDLNGTSFPSIVYASTSIDVNCTVRDEDDDLVSIFAVADDDYSHLRVLQSEVEP